MTIVRRAHAGDEEPLAILYSEMQQHYGSDDPPGGAERAARTIVAAQGHAPFALVAEQAERLLGFANLSPIFYGGGYRWLLFLKDVYVTSDARSRGVGRDLMRGIAREALESGYERVDWITDVDNYDAQALYDRVGAPRAERVFYRLANHDLRTLAADD